MLLPRELMHTVVLLFYFLPISTFAYQWPSPQYDALEEMLYEGIDLMGTPIADRAASCASRVFPGGPPVGAEWLRLAYHDMSTYNITDGTGGLDASTYYEYNRAENIGTGLVNSMNDFAPSANKYVSRADVIAMGAIWGVASCGGPIIPFRGGRIDALQAGRPGVPQPQESLADHTESFRLQGFTPTEMISLVACGHTFGAVRNIDFPDIVPNPGSSTENETLVAPFDSTNQFDSLVVSEYLEGTTKNPLVVGSNATLLSDMRVFSSDGNATMRSIATPESYSSTCKALFTRMIDTVPSQVQLTEEITYIPFKIRQARIIIVEEQVIFHTQVRVQVLAGETVNVTLLYCDRRGDATGCADGLVHFATSSTPSQTPLSPLSTALGIAALDLSFSAPIGSTSVGKFWFEVRHGNGTTVIQDNGGGGYFFEQDTLIAPSAVISRGASSDGFTESFLYVATAGVLGDGYPSLVQAQMIDKSVTTRIQSQLDEPSIPHPLNTTVNLGRNASVPAVGGYTFYSTSFIGPASATLDFSMVMNGTQYFVDFQSVLASVFDDFTISHVGKKSFSESSPTNATGSGSVTTKVPQKTSISSAPSSFGVMILGYGYTIALCFLLQYYL